MSASRPYADFVRFVEDLLDEHGPDSQSAVGWFRGDAEVRYRTMLGLIRPGPECVSLLDFGCGLGGLLQFIRDSQLSNVNYAGLDMSPRLLAVARERFPDTTFYEGDILADPGIQLPTFDYVVMNGIFTYRGEHSNDEMFAYLRELVGRAFELANIGVAFNVHTPFVDWQRADLFHASIDAIVEMLARNVSRHLVIRHDYGVYEYTVYVYRDPSDPSQMGAKRLISPPQAGPSAA